ncbi:CLUMA_CG005493, isoform A [Clunio marinus]|uniref:Beta-catenin-like protein 1 n=1 Tax=Clunio marinus TaxID=568069 RepID=A0A1J1HUW9_9DIPT|nr:CLUMA_CG005493, isoform A [Clunio marinus]
MDVSDLLSFKPETIPKRKQDDDEDTDGKQSEPKYSKKPKIEEKILELIDNADEDEDDEVLDEVGLKKLALLFEKRVLGNQKMRLKYPEDPQKFMDSEIDLHDAIKKLQAIATVPDLYPLLVSLNVVSSMLELLSHPNTDIAAAIIEILMELTDVDILHESTEGSEKLIDCLQEQNITKLLVSNCLERLDESVKEESDAVHNIFSIFENLTEFRPESCVEIAEQSLMQWILKRLKIKQYDANKLYCSEVLSILLQNTNENRILLGSIDGIDVLLQQLAIYKRHDPVTEEEKEYMENLFNCLCSSLLAKENRTNFLKGEGCQLMNLMLREKKLSRNGALKVLDYACAGSDGKENCLKFVDILGLRTIFPLFMKTPKKNKQRLLSSEEFEEHVCSIISSMLRNTKGSQKQRLLSKFVENDFEKVDRLMELHLKYLEKVEKIDREIEDSKRFKKPGDNNDEDEDDQEGNYMKRLSGGLFTLQLVDYIVLEIAISPDGPKIKQRLQQILNLRGSSLKVIKDVMREYAGNLGDAQNAEWREHEKQHVLSLINRF